MKCNLLGDKKSILKPFQTLVPSDPIKSGITASSTTITIIKLVVTNIRIQIYIDEY